MASVGPQNPATSSQSATISPDWSNPNNAFASDDARATCAITGANTNAAATEALILTNFDFSAIPGGATIDGIVVEIEKSVTSTSGNPKDLNVLLQNLAGDGATANRADTTNVWPTTDAYTTYGTSTDKWGASSITLSNLQSSSFGVSISARCSTGEGISTTCRVDHVRITVYYTSAGVSHKVDGVANVAKVDGVAAPVKVMGV